MLAIAVSGYEVRYIVWERDGENVALRSCQVIPWGEKVDGFHHVATIREMIERIASEIDPQDREKTYLTLDADFFQYSLLNVDPSWEVQEQIDHMTRSTAGHTPLYDSFQFPLDESTGSYLNINCPIVLRRAIMGALPNNATDSHVLTIGLFSSFNYMSRVVPALGRGRHLFWRVSGSGEDQMLEVEDGEYRALHLMNRTNDMVRIRTVGDALLQKPITALVEQLMEGEAPPFPEADNIFVYQGSGDVNFLEDVFGKEQPSLALMNPFWRWNWPAVPDADNKFTQSAFAELADAVWVSQNV